MKDVWAATTRAPLLHRRGDGPRSSMVGHVRDVLYRGERSLQQWKRSAVGAEGPEPDWVPAWGNRTVTKAYGVGGVGDAGWDTFYGTS